MGKKADAQHSVLIVSASDQFSSVVRKPLSGIIMVDRRKSVASARQCVLERYYDLIVINAPLLDEMGEQFALDITDEGHTSVLLAAPQEVCDIIRDHVTDRGVLVIAKPVPAAQLEYSVRFLLSVQTKMHELESKIRKAEEKLEEIRVVNRAKFFLLEKKHMTEEDAHRYIGQQAMNHGVSRRRIAEWILDE
ncbi:MAG: ANTAR domain-containing protein [Lachnospiraceae bacterium]|nr:ANTAR domain-containing protein [Lachnospiraceae bacterium]